MDAVTLTTVDGLPAVEIADAKGEVFAYTIEPGAEPNTWSLTKQPGGVPYLVRKLGPARWACPCKDFEFRNRAHRSRPPGAHCKHLEALTAYLALLAVLQQSLQPQGVKT